MTIVFPTRLAGMGLPGQSGLASLTPTVFHQEWWLDIASQGDFDILEVRQGGGVVGRLPYATRRQFGFRTVYMPPLTHVLGPAVDQGSGGPNARFLTRLSVTRELIRMLPCAAGVRQKLHRETADTLAFQAEGFRTSVLFTCEIAPAPPGLIWTRMRDKTRNAIRQAQRRLTVVPWDDPDAFIDFYGRNLSAKNVRNQLDPAVCRALIGASQQRGCGKVLSARDAADEVQAAIFVAWDEGTAHYLMSSRIAQANNGAVSLLLWEAIKHATAHNRIFDFAGIANEGAILFYAGFGGELHPCYSVDRARPVFRALRAAHRLRSRRASSFG